MSLSAVAPDEPDEPLLGGPAQVSGVQRSGGDSGADETCEVLSEHEFTHLATETLLASSPDLTAKQVLAIRGALVAFASERGWVD